MSDTLISVLNLYKTALREITIVLLPFLSRSKLNFETLSNLSGISSDL